MKYIYSILAPLALFSGKVFAANEFNFDQAAKDLAEGSPISDVNKIFTILKVVVQYAYRIFFIIAVLYIIIAAFNFLTAKGDAAKVQSARDQIKWAVVAIVIALISVGVAQIIKSFLENPTIL
jgi:hypothetical protein